MDSMLDPDKLPEDLELQLFLEDCPDPNPNLFFSETFPWTFFHKSAFLPSKQVIFPLYNSVYSKQTFFLRSPEPNLLQILNINIFQN